MLAKNLLETVGNATQANYIEDVFSTYLYTGNGSTQTINNGIDLAGKGGLVWAKSRSTGGTISQSHYLFDSARGYQYVLSSNLTDNEYGPSGANEDITSFNSNGFSLGAIEAISNVNISGTMFASWTFRKQPKFFDVVTYTGNGLQGREVAHNLGSVPGYLVVKKTSSTSDWFCWHRSLNGGTGNGWIRLNTTGAASPNGYQLWGRDDGTATYIAPTSSVFTVSADANVNESGATYVAYLFAHNAGGFGLTGTDNVISCGSYTGNGSTTGPVVTLGYEPQWLLIKKSSGTSYWHLLDSMRGLTATDSNDAFLYPNTSEMEDSTLAWVAPSATGFDLTTSHPNLNENGATYIYIAIRRGPMKVPTDGTKVYNAIVRNGTNAVANVTGVGFPPDLITVKNRNAGYDNNWVDKLRGALPILASSNTAAEVTDTPTAVTAFGQDGVTLGDNNAGTYGGAVNYFTANSYVNWFFRRAPGFFDEVCYTGNSNSRNLSHNLGVVPELAIVKCRDTATNWAVIYPSYIYDGRLNSSEAFIRTYRPDLTTRPWTTTTFSVGSNSDVNSIGQTYVAYLFASCPGVSKVGSYTGTGASQVINCDFTAGARFVLIKRTDSTGDWYTYDTARGIVAGSDPYLLLNSAAAEVTSTDYIDTASTGFEISSTAPDAINASGGTFIFLAIA